MQAPSRGGEEEDFSGPDGEAKVEELMGNLTESMEHLHARFSYIEASFFNKELPPPAEETRALSTVQKTRALCIQEEGAQTPAPPGLFNLPFSPNLAPQWPFGQQEESAAPKEADGGQREDARKEAGRKHASAPNTQAANGTRPLYAPPPPPPPRPSRHPRPRWQTRAVHSHLAAGRPSVRHHIEADHSHLPCVISRVLFCSWACELGAPTSPPPPPPWTATILDTDPARPSADAPTPPWFTRSTSEEGALTSRSRPPTARDLHREGWSFFATQSNSLSRIPGVSEASGVGQGISQVPFFIFLRWWVGVYALP